MCKIRNNVNKDLKDSRSAVYISSNLKPKNKTAVLRKTTDPWTIDIGHSACMILKTTACFPALSSGCQLIVKSSHRTATTSWWKISVTVCNIVKTWKKAQQNPEATKGGCCVCCSQEKNNKERQMHLGFWSEGSHRCWSSLLELKTD